MILVKILGDTITVSELCPDGTVAVDIKMGTPHCPVNLAGLGASELDKLGRVLTGAIAAVRYQSAHRNAIAGQAIATGPGPQIQVAAVLPPKESKK